MLILVAVTVSYGIKSGMLSKAKTAGTNYDKEQERETLAEAVAYAYDESTGVIVEGKLKAELGVESGSGWNVIKNVETETVTYTITSPSGNEFTVDSNGKVGDPVTLADYLLGNDHKGRILGDVNGNGIVDFTTWTFKNDENLEFEASNVSFVKTNEGLPYSYFFTDGVYYYCTYKEKKYKFSCRIDETKGVYYTMPLENGSIEEIYDENNTSRVGKCVSWDSNDDGKPESWIVLYDDTTNGLQIISENTMKYSETEGLHIGTNDTLLVANSDSEYLAITSEEKSKKAAYSYNKAIETLNSACDNLIRNRENVISVRCVGSNPSDPSSKSGNCSSTLATNLAKTLGFALQDGDTNAVADYDRMVGCGAVYVEDESEYWMASRITSEENGTIEFSIRTVYFSEEWCGGDFLGSIGSSTKGVDHYYDLRPVVKLDSNIIFEGEGTEAKPYTF